MLRSPPAWPRAPDALTQWAALAPSLPGPASQRHLSVPLSGACPSVPSWRFPIKKPPAANIQTRQAVEVLAIC